MRPAHAVTSPFPDATPHGKLLAAATTQRAPKIQAIGPWSLVVLGVLSLGLGVFLQVSRAPLAASLGVAGIGALMLGAGALLLRRRTGRLGELKVFERGVEVLTHTGDRLSATFEELEGVALEEKELLLNGEHNGWLRTLTLWAKGRQLTLQSHIKGGDGDAFGLALDAVLAQEAEQTAKSLESGGALKGEGWQLDRNGLKLEAGFSTPLSSFVATGANDNRAQAWRKGEEEPFFNVPLASRNARTALGVISRQLPKGEEARQVAGLGRRMITRGMTTRNRIIWGALAAVFFFPGLAAAFYEPGALVGVAIAAVFALIGFATPTTDIYERGVRQRNLFGQKELKFLEVDAYTHATTRHFYNGAYTGTSHNLVFMPSPGAGKKIAFNFMARGTDEDLERLRDAMARIVAQGLYTRLQQGARVQWGSAELAKDGIHFHEAKLIGKGAPAVLPYAGSRYSFSQGACFLFAATGDKHVTQVSCAGVNFFPGFELYQRLCTEAESGLIRPAS